MNSFIFISKTKHTLVLWSLCIVLFFCFLPSKAYAATDTKDAVGLFAINVFNDIDSILGAIDIGSWFASFFDNQTDKDAKDFEKKLIEKDAIDCLSPEVFKYCYTDHPNVCNQQGIENKEDWVALPEKARMDIIKNNDFFQSGRDAWNKTLNGYSAVYDDTYTDPLKNHSPAEKLFFERCPPKTGSKSIKKSPYKKTSTIINPVATLNPVIPTLVKVNQERHSRLVATTCDGKEFSFVPPPGYKMERIKNNCITADNEKITSMYYDFTAEDGEGFHWIEVNRAFYGEGVVRPNERVEKVTIAGHEEGIVVSKIDEPLSPSDVEERKALKKDPDWLKYSSAAEQKENDAILAMGNKAINAEASINCETVCLNFTLSSTSLDEKYLGDFKTMLSSVKM